MQPAHISLYVALFQMWDVSGFQTRFYICRRDVMRLSKIKSFATYHKCLKDIHSAGFIIYSPTYNSYDRSSIEIVDFENLEIEVIRNKGRLKDEVLKFTVPSYFEVELFFNERDMLSEDAKNFYTTYQSKDWKLCNNNQMKCWRSAARIWIGKIKNID